MPNKSKTKGHDFERSIAKELTEATGSEWLRSSGSGSYYGKSHSKRMANASTHALRNRTGDLTPPDGWRITVECKRYRELPNLLHGSSELIDGFLNQLNDSAIDGDLQLLIMKADRCPIIAMMPHVQAQRLAVFPFAVYATAGGRLWKAFPFDQMLSPENVDAFERLAAEDLTAAK